MMVTGGQILLGALCLAAAALCLVVPGLRSSVRIASHRRARVWIAVVFGCLFLGAAASGRDLLATLTASLLLCSLVLMQVERRDRAADRTTAADAATGPR